MQNYFILNIKGLGVVMKRYLVWCTLSTSVFLCTGQQPLSLKKIATQTVVRHVTYYSAEQLQRLPADLIEILLQNHDISLYCPYLTIPTPESRSVGHPILMNKTGKIYTFKNGNYIILRDLNDRRWLLGNYDNHNHFFIQIKTEDGITIASLGQHNISPITSLCMHTDEKKCAIGRKNGSISLFNLQDYTQHAEVPLLDTYVKAMIYSGNQLIAYNKYDQTYVVDTKTLYRRAWLPDTSLSYIWQMDTLNTPQKFHILWLKQIMPRINAPFLMHYFFDQYFTADKIYLLLHYAALKKAITILIKKNHSTFISSLIDNFAILLSNNNISSAVVDDLISQLKFNIIL